MLTNYHNHSTFCDGKNTPEEVILTAIEKGFDAIGFSGHGFTEFDQRYCMKNPPAFRAAIKELKEKYKDRIQVYLGVEEDMFAPVNRDDYEYMVGSCHYIHKDGGHYPIDSGLNYFHKCLELFDGDALAMADSYYSHFCEYIVRRKPDIVGHFDLVTKFEEAEPHGLFGSEEYRKMAEKYLLYAMKSGSLCEVNTGAISRGYRTTPYPTPDLLYTLLKNDGKLILSADSHTAETIDFYFKESRAMLKDVGFTHVYALYNGEFVKDYL